MSSNENNIGESSRPKMSDQGIPLQSQEMLFQQPDKVQAIVQLKTIFRNFVNCDTQQKIYHTDEVIEVTSKMIKTKQDLQAQYSQKLHIIDKTMKEFSDTTLKKIRDFKRIRQIYEVNCRNIEQSHTAFIDLFGLASTKELELADLRARDLGYTEKVNQLKGDLKDTEDNFKRMNDQDERLRRSLIEAKMQNEQILEQNMEIEENLAKLNAEAQDIIDRQTEVTNEFNNIKESILVMSTNTAQNREEIAKLKPINEDICNIVTSNTNTVERLDQQLEMAKVNLVDSRVNTRMRMSDLQRRNNDIKKEIENARDSFNAKRNAMLENIRLETERLQKEQQLADERKQQAIDNPPKPMKQAIDNPPKPMKQAIDNPPKPLKQAIIDKPPNPMKRKSTPARPRLLRGNDDTLIDLANTTIGHSSSSNSLQMSFLTSKRAKIMKNTEPIMEATMDSDSDTDNFEM